MSLISYNIALLNILSIFKYYRNSGRTAGLHIQTPTTIPTTELRLTKNVPCASKLLFRGNPAVFSKPYNTWQIPYYLYLKITGISNYLGLEHMLDLNSFWEDELFIKDVFLVIILYSNL